MMFKEVLYLVVGDDARYIIVEVNMRGTGDDEQFLVPHRLALALYMLACHQKPFHNSYYLISTNS